LIPYLGILTVIHVLRTLRWGSLLAGLEKVPFRPLNEAAGIGFMMLIVLPFRLGEFARPFLIAQRSSIRRSAAMTSVVLERIVDGIFIAVLLRVLMFFVPADSPQISHLLWGANLMFAVFFGGLLFLVFAVWQRERAVRWVKAIGGRVSPSLGEKLSEIVDAFVGAMRQLPSLGHVAAFVLYTFVIWGITGLGMAVLSRAFGIDLSPFQAFVVMSVLVVGLMIPAAPGSAGTFQAAVIIGLSVFLPQATVNGAGVAYANVVWLVQTAQQILFGVILLALGKQSFSELAHKLEDEAVEEPMSSSQQG
jgi:uncharacterized protein (TIRG00374 family)